MASRPGNVPVSEILKNAASVEDEPKKKSREDWRKQKELEEARKAGTAPAATDEEGKDINPHIPQYISSTPWYFGAKGLTLKHQRPQPEKQKQFSEINDWYIRGQSNKVATKWRPGACDNCGAMGHKRKDCFEKPRKVLAKFSNSNIAPDEFVQPNLALDYDGKRDRWAGYDPSEHRLIVEEYQKVEEAKKQLRAETLNSKDEEGADEQDSDDDEDKYVDEVDMPGTKVDSKQRITVRNLRIREDTANYLRNLDPNSAYYDPKTRSMRDNPYAGTERESDYTGGNAAKFTGDTQKHANAQLFAWDAADKGVSAHLLAEPTKVELLKHEFDKKKELIKNDARESLIEKYGGEEHLDVPSAALLLPQNDAYVEYSRTGNIVKAPERRIIRSKYEEDVYINNHTSVFGSYWNNGQWGYKCCHAFIKNSYCCGEAGKEAMSESEAYKKRTVPSTSIAAHIEPSKVEEEEEKEEIHEEETDEKKKLSRKNSSSDSSSESSEEDTRTKTERKSKKDKRKNKKKKQKDKKKNKNKNDKELTKEEKLKKALKKEEESRMEAERLLKMDERKRPYNSMYNVKELTEEEKEAYQMKRFREDDPMADFMSR